MTQRVRVPVVVEAPAALNVGGRADANDIIEILAGDITLDFPSCAAGAAVSASAAVAALQVANKLGSKWVIMLQAQAWAALDNCHVNIATGIANGIQASATNLGTAASDNASRQYSYLAIRVNQQVA